MNCFLGLFLSSALSAKPGPFFTCFCLWISNQISQCLRCHPMAGSIPNHFKGPYLGWIGKRLPFLGKYRRFPWVLCRCVRSWAFLEGTEFFQVFLWIRKKGVGLLADIQGIERLKLAFRLIVAAFQLSQKMWAALFVRNEPQFLVVFGWELSSITETSLIILFSIIFPLWMGWINPRKIKLNTGFSVKVWMFTRINDWKLRFI